MSKRHTIGIVGGGQLARMLVQIGSSLGLRFKIYDPAPEACAGHLAPITCGAFADSNALLAFARDIDVLTFDFENVPAATLGALEHALSVRPNPRALAMTQDRLSEKQAFSALNIPVAPYHAVASLDDLQAAISALGAQGILKTRTLGYDGKGQQRIRSAADAPPAIDALGGSLCVYEQLVPFKRELSIVATRAADGSFVCYPLVQNIHDQGILAVTIAPADCSQALRELANGYARQVADAFDYVGTFALEFFDLGDDQLVLNEMAPRVHNSGHWSIEGAECSQFENHLRAIAGLPLGSTAVRQPTVMLNWIGELPNKTAQLAIPGLHFHDYGKGARAGRKVGHSTICAATDAQLLERLAHLQKQSPTRSAELALAALQAK
jgi:5-(carboxyamino)imidazole ribonucleotide synthase